jgi:regulator of sirC expression with transglutaminase-like and TPR domain
MDAPASLTLFAHVIAQREEDLDLAEAALLIAEAEQPGLEIPRYLKVLDEMGEDARRTLERPLQRPEATRGSGPIERMLMLLYGRLGFRGNVADYYDPRNSYLNHVLDRRLGIPITLAVVLLEICRRAGIDAQGVSFPGHFLVRVPLGPAEPRPPGLPAGAGQADRLLFIDPFEGRLLTRDDLRALCARSTGVAQDPDPRMLVPASKRQILVRMLNNLRIIFAKRQEPESLCRVIERMQVLSPSEELRRELEQLGGDRPWPSRGHTLH